MIKIEQNVTPGIFDADIYPDREYIHLWARLGVPTSFRCSVANAGDPVAPILYFQINAHHKDRGRKTQLRMYVTDEQLSEIEKAIEKYRKA